ncbi:hypothetical protein EPUL_005451, partial [Erysiphe pulchra]
TRSPSQASKSRGEDDGSLSTRPNILEDKFEEIIDDIEKSNNLMEDRLKIMANAIKDEVENKIESKMRSEFEPITEVLKRTFYEMHSVKNNPTSPKNSFLSVNSKVLREENLRFQPEDDIFKQDEEIKSEPSRRSNGDFNPQIPLHLPQARTAQEKRILKDWPEVVLPSQAHLYGATSQKDRVNFAPGTFLSFADSKVLPTLVQVQDQLKTALIP